MRAFWFRRQERPRPDPDGFFRALHSFSGLSTGAVVILGIASVGATGFIEWVTDLPLPNDVVFVLIVGGATFHGSATAGVFLAALAGAVRLISTGAPFARVPIGWPLAAVEGLALVALLLGFVLLARTLHRAMDALQHQALRDSLTGTLNARGFLDVAERERLRTLRNEQPLTIAYFDIDGLKNLNDAAGHQAGDRLLVRFAAAVEASIRAYDIFARMGGDEFVLILPAADQQEALGVVTRIRDQLVRQQPPLLLSVGVVTYSAPADSVESMLQAADGLMYQAKRAGGNRLVGEVRSAKPGSNHHLITLGDLATQH
ncbi:MAG: GGDEF domain-containing protein [Acidimicrobiia bacterium]|nr:GGDEF domain-containing protein [Acidimicrobiia bacterium]MDH3396628.1 GGDEF domain-containing protein [Acidimicrobiia bacterium]MDH5615521.1 GGDEF domain-containing protein [Acidimicrobiia bacterium]